MAPRRSRRRIVSAYKEGDYVEYKHRGITVTGRLVSKSPNGTNPRPVWVVSPSDRRGRYEEIPEKSLGKIVGADRGGATRESQVGGDRSLDGAQGRRTRGSSSEENAEGGEDKAAAAKSSRKRGGDRSRSAHRERPGKVRKTARSPSRDRSRARSRAGEKRADSSSSSTRIGTRSTRRGGAADPPVPPPDLPARKKKLHGLKRVRKSDNVTVVRMLTGTLYLYRGDRPRAEFVRTK